jgi:hypothetical protein
MGFDAKIKYVFPEFRWRESEMLFQVVKVLVVMLLGVLFAYLYGFIEHG